jgi:EAL domain-containing protein (putative c-di-GMP-specific phosphodiesterase class I)
VETAAQLEFLRTHRCDQAQGYLISKPISLAELERLLGSGSSARYIARSKGALRD